VLSFTGLAEKNQEWTNVLKEDMNEFRGLNDKLWVAVEQGIATV